MNDPGRRVAILGGIITGLLAALALSSCANTEYGGINYASVVAPNGEEWKVASGKDQTNTKLTIIRGDVTVVYSSEKEDASTPLALAMKAQTDMIHGLIQQLIQALAAAGKGTGA